MANDGWNNKWPSGAGWFDKPKLEDAAKLKSPEDWLTHTSDATTEAAGVVNWPKFKQTEASTIIYTIKDAFWPKSPDLTGWDLGIGERTFLTTFKNDTLNHKLIHQTELKAQGSNLVDDEKYLYFQCDNCNEILDPHTKSFAKLQEHRVNAGWKCVWNIDGMGYKVYCAECGEKVK